MAHIAKYKAHSCGHMLAHYRRDHSSLGRDNIDPERTHLDQTLELDASGRVVAGAAKPSWETIRQRIEKADAGAREAGKRATRKDAVVLADIVVTLPENVPERDEERFFELTYAYIATKVGTENLMGGFVHRDEVRTKKVDGVVVKTGEPVRDHMHVPFTPILDGRFNYKKLVPRSFYQSFHKGLGDYLEARLGYRPEVELSAERQAEKELSSLPHTALEKAREAQEAAQREAAQAQAEAAEALRAAREAQEAARAAVELAEEAERARADAVAAKATAEAETAEAVGRLEGVQQAERAAREANRGLRARLETLRARVAQLARMRPVRRVRAGFARWAANRLPEGLPDAGAVRREMQERREAMAYEVEAVSRRDGTARRVPGTYAEERRDAELAAVHERATQRVTGGQEDYRVVEVPDRPGPSATPSFEEIRRAAAASPTLKEVRHGGHDDGVFRGR